MCSAIWPEYGGAGQGTNGIILQSQHFAKRYTSKWFQVCFCVQCVSVSVSVPKSLLITENLFRLEWSIGEGDLLRCSYATKAAWCLIHWNLAGHPTHWRPQSSYSYWTDGGYFETISSHLWIHSSYCVFLCLRMVQVLRTHLTASVNWLLYIVYIIWYIIYIEILHGIAGSKPRMFQASSSRAWPWNRHLSECNRSLVSF